MSAIFEFVAAHWITLGFMLTTVIGFVSTILYKTKHDTSATALKAFSEGTRAGLADMATGKDPVTAIGDAVMAAARVYDVVEHVEDHVVSLSQPLSPPPPSL